MNTRYQIVYSKSGHPLVVWKNDHESALQVAWQLRKLGYTVDVWEHTKDGARKSTL